MANYEHGTYSCRIQGQRFGVLPNQKQTPYFELEFIPQEALDCDLPEVCYRDNIKIWMSEKAIPFAVERLRELGWTGSDLTELDPASGVKHSFDGVEIDLKCTVNEEGWNRWDFPYPPGGEQKESVGVAGIAAKLSRDFGGALKVGAAPKAKKKVPVGPSGDEIPF